MKQEQSCHLNGETKVWRRTGHAWETQLAPMGSFAACVKPSRLFFSSNDLAHCLPAPRASSSLTLQPLGTIYGPMQIQGQGDFPRCEEELGAFLLLKVPVSWRHPALWEGKGKEKGKALVVGCWMPHKRVVQGHGQLGRAQVYPRWEG